MKNKYELNYIDVDILPPKDPRSVKNVKFVRTIIPTIRQNLKGPLLSATCNGILLREYCTSEVPYRAYAYIDGQCEIIVAYA